MKYSTARDQLLLIVFSLILVSACHIEKKKEFNQEYPNEWMYNQRAYPDNYINRKAISDGIEQTQLAISQKGINSSGSWYLKGPINIGGRITDVNNRCCNFSRQ